MLLFYGRNICNLASLIFTGLKLPRRCTGWLFLALPQEAQILPTHVAFELRQVMRFFQGKDFGIMYWGFRSDKTTYLF